MAKGGFNSTDYLAGVDHLKKTGATFQRSTVAAQTGNYRQVAEILDPRKLKNGMRECCFAPGFATVLPIVVSIDGTGSMEAVPGYVQQELPKLMELLVEQGIELPNVMFMLHDDEKAMPPDAVFQMSQFEADAPELVKSLNEMIIPGFGGGNRGEAYHLSFYAAAKHTRQEPFERDGSKGIFIMVCDEEPYYCAGDPSKHGTSPRIAKEVFGDTNELEITMLESVKKVAEHYHIFVIRPGHTNHGRDSSITRLWQKLLSDAGENPEHVIEVSETEALISTMALSIGNVLGADRDELIDVLTTKGAKGVDSAVAATKDLVAASDGALAVVGKTSGAIATSGEKNKTGRVRRS